MLVAALSMFGLVMVSSVTGAMGSMADGYNERFVVRQGVALCLGVVGAIVVSWLGTAWLTSSARLLPLCLGVLGMLVAVPYLGVEVNGAKRWLAVGPVRIQPSELVKLALICLTAWYYGVMVKEKVKLHWQGVFLPLAGFVVISGLIYLTRDLGSIVVLAGILWTMVFFAGARWFYVTGVGVLLLPLVAFFAVFREAYRRERMLAFWDPWTSDSPAAYHLKQSLTAVGSGGVCGQGLGQGLARGGWLPERHTDFIYAVICQEFGLIGAIVVVLCYLALVAVGLLIANSTHDRHQRLLAVGCTMLIGLQAFWNMAVVVGAAPTKGLTLPFISYGGSSLVVCLLTVGLLDAVARNLKRPELSQRFPLRVGAASTRISRNRAAL
jgi:cell division protein FtsW